MESVPAGEVDHEVGRQAKEFLGEGYDKIAAFGDALAAEGVLRGLIGPRELPRLWERHLLNSASLLPFLPAAGTVVDVGSGAGLPGLVIACARPDLEVVLVEPMERRATWLREMAQLLELDAVTVVQRRAEEVHGELEADVVTARAVAPLDRLMTWCFPLVRVGGSLLAMKGSRAQDEVDAAASLIERLGGAPAELLRAETIAGVEPTGLVRVVRVRPAPPARKPKRPRRR
ncbi:16S rRNA (guanine(527)-N(7))-methyltransferase RsmG [Actinotalea fermentans]|uniref:Ribosomal RNA small subunit methyltransferase G n=1 Tax=Actinotalea fermentans TaxID=43671 RepID=A0A511Z250_9CELL|nr:16S rRNA (guanine(527)-N(7))-methyltransferase RsmG [Actinotalea fermentans]KGM16832.1 16S rRNA methyltransferase [Actinotalea fermentans ATCC 43279 = JCM 9966 = DSM 3133]GEN81527.1 ribosomal RNA small subunit methyltransferase G [Actinotalea fermentans]